MLRRVGETVDSKDAVVKIKDASFPTPFVSALEYNSPVHGNWNIVHTGMQVPESIQIYVCADNCMRGVVLTAAEMNAADRFFFFFVNYSQMRNRAILPQKPTSRWNPSLPGHLRPCWRYRASRRRCRWSQCGRCRPGRLWRGSDLGL